MLVAWEPHPCSFPGGGVVQLGRHRVGDAVLCVQQRKNGIRHRCCGAAETEPVEWSLRREGLWGPSRSGLSSRALAGLLNQGTLSPPEQVRRLHRLAPGGDSQPCGPPCDGTEMAQKWWELKTCAKAFASLSNLRGKVFFVHWAQRVTWPAVERGDLWLSSPPLPASQPPLPWAPGAASGSSLGRGLGGGGAAEGPVHRTPFPALRCACFSTGGQPLLTSMLSRGVRARGVLSDVCIVSLWGGGS